MKMISSSKNQTSPTDYWMNPDGTPATNRHIWMQTFTWSHRSASLWIIYKCRPLFFWIPLLLLMDAGRVSFLSKPPHFLFVFMDVSFCLSLFLSSNTMRSLLFGVNSTTYETNYIIRKILTKPSASPECVTFWRSWLPKTNALLPIWLWTVPSRNLQLPALKVCVWNGICRKKTSCLLHWMYKTAMQCAGSASKAGQAPELTLFDTANVTFSLYKEMKR